MYSDKFLKFIEIWQNEFGIEKTFYENKSIDKDGNPLPWYTYPAIEYLTQFDYRDKEIFEYGSGYSTLFWANRAKKVTSIEDNKLWYDKWQLSPDFAHLDIRLRDQGQDYYNSIREDNKAYDVIVIDGKCRAECAKEAVKTLKYGGIIILDDSDRVNNSKEYAEAIATLKEKNLLEVDFYGFCPMNNYPKTTSLFLSRTFDFKLLNDIQPVNGIGNLWGMGRKQRKEFYKANR